MFALVGTVLNHTLEALLICIMDLRDLNTILSQLVDQLISIKHAVRASCLDDLALLVQREVLPCEAGTDDLLEQAKHLVVRNSTRVGEVVDASLVSLGKDDGGGKEIVQNGVAVWYIDDAFVLCDLGDKVAGVQVVGYWHAKAQAEDVLVVHHDLERLSADTSQYLIPWYAHLLNSRLGS